MQSKLLNRLLILIVVIVSLYAFISIIRQAASNLPASSVLTSDTATSSLPAVPSPVPPVPAPISASSSVPVPVSPVPASVRSSPSSLLPPPYPILPIHAPLGTVRAFVASTSAQQELGLGQRGSLPTDEGMLFPFAVPGDYGFWMKDMRFPLDMVWILPDKSAAGVTAGISPDTYPTVFFPPADISYVLELNAGAAARLGIATGTQLVF